MQVPTLTLLTLLASSASAYWKGFNLPGNLPSGACKGPADWKKDFAVIKSFPGKFNAVRLYAASDCNTLANAVPAAKAAGIKILVGVWTEDDAHFNAEKAALLRAIRAHGSTWISAISVGSEDLYRKDTSASVLASKIYDVRGMLTTVNARNIQVGHTDTWTAWVDPKNEAVIKACDFVGTDGYPYFQSEARKDGYKVFWQSVNDVRRVVDRVKPGVWVWVAETGWPVGGKTMGKAIPSVAGAAAYWKSVACSSFNQAHTFWYILQDYHQSPSFGVVDKNFKPLFDLRC